MALKLTLRLRPLLKFAVKLPGAHVSVSRANTEPAVERPGLGRYCGKARQCGQKACFHGAQRVYPLRRPPGGDPLANELLHTEPCGPGTVEPRPLESAWQPHSIGVTESSQPPGVTGRALSRGPAAAQNTYHPAESSRLNPRPEPVNRTNSIVRVVAGPGASVEQSRARH